MVRAERKTLERTGKTLKESGETLKERGRPWRTHRRVEPGQKSGDAHSCRACPVVTK